MDNAIDYTPAPQTAEMLNALLMEEVNRWVDKGWELSLRDGLFRLNMVGRPEKTIRNGVIHHG